MTAPDPIAEALDHIAQARHHLDEAEQRLYAVKLPDGPADDSEVSE